MLDMLEENLLNLSQAARIFPGGPHKSTVHRYVTHGIHGVRLETVLVGGKRLTSKEAIVRFLMTLNAQCPPRPNKAFGPEGYKR